MPYELLFHFQLGSYQISRCNRGICIVDTMELVMNIAPNPRNTVYQDIKYLLQQPKSQDGEQMQCKRMFHTFSRTWFRSSFFPTKRWSSSRKLAKVYKTERNLILQICFYLWKVFWKSLFEQNWESDTFNNEAWPRSDYSLRFSKEFPNITSIK